MEDPPHNRDSASEEETIRQNVRSIVLLTVTGVSLSIAGILLQLLTTGEWVALALIMEAIALVILGIIIGLSLAERRRRIRE